MNKKLYQPEGKFHSNKLRVWKFTKPSQGVTVKCGCCNETVKIFYDEDSWEINGVHASVEEWKRLFKIMGGGKYK